VDRRLNVLPLVSGVLSTLGYDGIPPTRRMQP